MKYLGIFCEGQFYCGENPEDYGILHGYLEDGLEIIILYDRHHPFLMKRIGVFLDETKSNILAIKWYNLWNYEYFSQDEIECITVAKKFAIETTKFLRDTLKFFKDTERITERPSS